MVLVLVLSLEQQRACGPVSASCYRPQKLGHIIGAKTKYVDTCWPSCLCRYLAKKNCRSEGKAYN